MHFVSEAESESKIYTIAYNILSHSATPMIDLMHLCNPSGMVVNSDCAPRIQFAVEAIQNHVRFGLRQVPTNSYSPRPAVNLPFDGRHLSSAATRRGNIG